MAATMRLLVVEDEQRLAAGLRKGLEAEGFAVDVVHNGTDGIWMARENPFDAIILDVMLPGANGYQVCRTLRGTVNLIRYNEVEGLPFTRPETQAMLTFQSILRNAGIVAHVRKSRGRDIDAACGQLRRKAQQELVQVGTR